MTLQQRRLARSRLGLGITNVGFWVLLAAGGLFWLAGRDTRDLDLFRLGVIFLTAVAVQSVFDFVGGAWLMPEPRPSVKTFLRGWAPGAVAHTLVLAGVGLLSYASFQRSGGFCLAIGVATAGLALGRRPLLRAVAGVSTAEIQRAGEIHLTADVRDPAFTGGVVGFGRSARSLLPARWLDDLPPGELAAESGRRRWQMENGLPVRALVLTLGWNLLGGFLGPLIFDLGGRRPAEALLGHACWMTLWTFGGLLVLPSLSRRAVFAADRAAAEAGLDPRGWIRRFPGLVGEDGSPDATVQTLFYPIPSAASRLRRLEQPVPGWVPGNLARNNLYYSWATFTILGRAVHCNVGRPALWVFPPAA